MANAYINGKYLSQKLSGVQRYAHELVTYLPTHTTVIAPGNNNAAAYNTAYGFQTTGANGSILWEQFKLPSYLRRKNKPLLVNLCNAAPVLYSNKISCIHDIAFIRYPQFFSKSFYWYYKILISLVIKTSRHIITVSEFSKAELMEHYKLKQKDITVIPNASSLNRQQTSIKPPHARPYFLFVGSLDPRKNLTLLLEAYVKAGLKNVDLLVVGAAHKSFNTGIAQKIAAYRDKPGIVFLQNVDDAMLCNLYAHAVAMVAPSFYEGFGLPLIEALSFGCPVLASGIPSFREVAGRAARYFNPEDADQLAGLLWETGTKREQLNQSALQVQQKYSWAKSAEKLKALIEQYS